MAIHHDKMAYGKLAKTSEELSEEKLAEMLKRLNGENCEDGENADNCSADKSTDKKTEK